MKNTNSHSQRDLGMIGLGVMGRNLLLNVAEHGFRVAGYDKDPAKVDALREESKAENIRGTAKLDDFIGQLRSPRAIMLLVPAGGIVDTVIDELRPHLTAGDVIIDAGNSYFKDTDLRARSLSEKGIAFLGVGVSGGEEGARHGPSIMPGGPKEAYERVRPILEAAAAKVDEAPCVAWLGPGSAGHFVKMVHNGIEYGIMQLIAETYDLMKRGVGLSDDELSEVYGKWNQSELASYLIEITSHIFVKGDKKTGKRLIDEILDVAKQKGTGMWTSQSAMELQLPIPTIDVAVAMRNLSVLENQRERASSLFPEPKVLFKGDRNELLKQLKNALYGGMILTYAQGMALLSVASEKHQYGLDLETVARIWRGGCIIRAALLEDIRAAYRRQRDLPNLLLDEEFSNKLRATENSLRQVVRVLAELSLPGLGLMTALGYFDGFRRSWLPANLIQAQRDYFGSHTYERVDAKGTFHTEWLKE